MLASNGDHSQFIPPPEGGGNWLRFHGCPYPAHGDLAPWFKRFAGIPAAGVRGLLQHEWGHLQHPALKRFADGLLRCHPCGLLRSDHEDRGDNAWLVLSQAPPSHELSRAIAGREDRQGLFYLAAPYAGLTASPVDLNELLVDFLLRFGGLRLSPPFVAGFFYRLPVPPTLIETDELDRPKDSEWRRARAVFISRTGDELLVTPGGRGGWVLHGTRELVPMGSMFDDVLHRLATETVLGPYDV
jgi:hypothetical protein